MAKGDPLTGHQQKIVDRYYDHLDSTALQRLQELVSEIYLAEPGPKKDKLWRTVETHLSKTGAPSGQAARVLADQDVKQLAQLITDLTGRKPGLGKPAAPAAAPAAQTPATPAASAPTAPPAPAAPAAPSAAAPAPASAAPAFTHEDLKMALKAFKKRLKLSKLDEESKLGRNPLTSGKGSGIVAIAPPNQYPYQIWEELVKQGRLKPAGRGFYSLVGE